MNALQQAEQFLLSPAGMSSHDVERCIGHLNAKGVDYGDLYFQQSFTESWVLEDQVVKQGHYDVERGVGVRAISGEKSGFAYADDIAVDSLLPAVNAAKSITHADQTVPAVRFNTPTTYPLRYPAINPLEHFKSEDKVKLLREIDAYARSLDPRVKKVSAGLNSVYEVILVAGTDGTYVPDIRPLVRINISVIAEQNGMREQGYAGGGGRYTFETLLENNTAKNYAKEAVRLALLNLEAKPAPAGEMPVLLGAGWPGVLLHEAIGHGLEGDFNRKGTSAFSGRLGEQVASSLCTIVDDGTLANRRGSLTIDDEGTQSQCTTLIENGILKNYMQDKHNARLMGMKPTGNGRRESYSYQPMPRMTNTYMLAGPHDPEEIIQSIDHGIFAVQFAGGQVDITSGKFVFSANEAYLIKHGKIQHPIKGVTLIGDGPTVLQRVSMVGNNLELDEGIGICGKDGQSVPVGVGQPTLKVDQLTVGGTAS